MAWQEAYYRRAWDAVMAAVTGHGAAISHHHGIGLNRSRFMADALGPAFGVLAAIKAALDPGRHPQPRQARPAHAPGRGGLAVTGPGAACSSSTWAPRACGRPWCGPTPR